MRCITTVSGSLTTCRLNEVRAVVSDVVPREWTVGVIGSTLRCSGEPCSAVGVDADLVIVHPIGAESEVVRARRELVAAAAEAGWCADVTVMSAAEVVSTGFWSAEQAKDLACAGSACPPLFGRPDDDSRALGRPR